MREENAKCPKCGKGLMKMLLSTTPLGSTPKTKPMQAHCNECGHEDDYTKIYPFKKR